MADQPKPADEHEAPRLTIAEMMEFFRYQAALISDADHARLDKLKEWLGGSKPEEFNQDFHDGHGRG